MLPDATGRGQVTVWPFFRVNVSPSHPSLGSLRRASTFFTKSALVGIPETIVAMVATCA